MSHPSKLASLHWNCVLGGLSQRSQGYSDETLDIFKIVLVINDWGMYLDLSDDKLTLVQLMVWCPQAKSHYLKQCWPGSVSTHVVTRPQWADWRYLSTWHLVLHASVTHLPYWDLMTQYGDIDLSQHWFSNGLFPDGTKPVPEPMLSVH